MYLGSEIAINISILIFHRARMHQDKHIGLLRRLWKGVQYPGKFPRKVSVGTESRLLHLIGTCHGNFG